MDHDRDVPDALEEDIRALLPPRTTEYRSGSVHYTWPEREEPITQPLRVQPPVPDTFPV